MSLRDEIAHRLCERLGDHWVLNSGLYRSDADAILALVLAHLTSDEAVTRGVRRWFENEEITDVEPEIFDEWVNDFRAAILAALGEGE